MERILSTYVKKYRFKHPTSADFQKIVEQVTRTSWSDYFDQYVYGNGMADFAVEKIRVTPVQKDGQTLYESSVTIAKKAVTTAPFLFALLLKTGISSPSNGMAKKIASRIN